MHPEENEHNPCIPRRSLSFCIPRWL
jgi:hypothetical protein